MHATIRATATGWDWSRTGSLSATAVLHVAALALACIPAMLPDKLPPAAAPVLYWIEPVAPPPVVSLPPPPQPVPRPRPAPVVPAAPAAPVIVADAPPLTESHAISPVPAVSPAVVDTTASLASSSAVDGLLAYERVREPHYPPDALRRGEQGTVVLRVWVAVDGGVRRIEIARSSGWPRLDRAARDAVKLWRFRPPQKAGVATEGSGLVPIVFALPERR